MQLAFCSAHTQTHARAHTHILTHTLTRTHKQVRSCYTIEQQVALTLHLQPLNTPQKKKSQLNTTEEEEVDERAPVGQSRVSE